MAASSRPPTASDQTASIRGWEITEFGAQAISVQLVNGDCRTTARYDSPPLRRVTKPSVVESWPTSACVKASPAVPAPLEAAITMPARSRMATFQPLGSLSESNACSRELALRDSAMIIGEILQSNTGYSTLTTLLPE